ncbi:HAD-IIIA family hydrolase [Nocardiopsis listeri]|uniref:HAD-IIIA family hydrolase n=1 Tax=Nocardiopsis listeri TaxID=53440 RepID=UPI000ABD3BB3|nr:HAD-IIIA family hydrolase [Nocardiopsis listeri]
MMDPEYAPEYAIVVPTVGRPGLAELLRPVLEAPEESAPSDVVVVDDRPEDEATGPLPGIDDPRVRTLRTGGRGPATARQAGWQSCTAPWIVFLDDDVRPPWDWAHRLRGDLRSVPRGVAGTQGRIVVPRPEGRRPTDSERNTIALERARWITADLALRRSALERVGGFDTRFRRAYREDTDLALRLEDAGFRLRQGARVCVHPLAEGRPRASLSAQRGNADDVLMRHLHGTRWRERVEEPRGTLRSHLITTALPLAALAATVKGHPRLAAAAGALWAARTVGFAARRIVAGPARFDEWVDMALTSVAIPPLAVWYRGVGELRYARAHRRPSVRAVLFDRDGTLVEDVPYNGDPDRVVPRPGAAEAVALAREHGLAVAVVTNQSGIGRKMITEEDVAAVNRRIDRLIGPVDLWSLCPHREEDGCSCRKPRPGMVVGAAWALGVAPAECAVVGDIGADVEAAAAAGARGILVPTPRTREEEVRGAPEVAEDPFAAVSRLVEGGRT